MELRQKVVKFIGMILRYRSPFSIFQLLDNFITVIGVGRLDCLLTYRRKVEVGNKPCRFLRVRAEEDVANADIPMIDPKTAEGPEALRGFQCLI